MMRVESVWVIYGGWRYDESGERLGHIWVVGVMMGVESVCVTYGWLEIW